MRTPSPPNASFFAQTAKVPRFTPARPIRRRRTGWTSDRQRRFIAAFVASGCVAQAARTVGLSVTSAYKLRSRPGAESFAAAWDMALADARRRALAFAMDAALSPTCEPRRYRGNFTGTIVRGDDRRAMLIALRGLTAAPPTAKVEK